MEDEKVEVSNKWLQNLSDGTISHQLEALSLGGLKIVKDSDGNWHVGAMATLIDDVGAAAIYSFSGHIKASLDFNISFYSTAKVQEQVEIAAKVVGEKGKLMSVVIEVRRKNNGELIALGKQWMASNNIATKASKL